MDSLPNAITAGTTLDYLITLTAYPASSWDLYILLRGPQPIDIIAAPEGNGHRIRVEAEITGAWMPGEYRAVVRVTDGVDVFDAESGRVTIAPDIAQAAAGFDDRGHVERTLANIEAVIEGRAGKDQERYRINNRELYRTPIADLLKLRTTYRNELARIKQAQRGNELLGRTVKVRF